ncbi:UNVERIFIED_CONTAM: hypothetical protein ABID98_003097 [Brevibacillus sp. OAP136]
MAFSQLLFRFFYLFDNRSEGIFARKWNASFGDAFGPFTPTRCGQRHRCRGTFLQKSPHLHISQNKKQPQPQAEVVINES